MSNEVVVIFVLCIVFAFSLWLGSGIVMLKKMLERIEQFLRRMKTDMETNMTITQEGVKENERY